MNKRISSCAPLFALALSPLGCRESSETAPEPGAGSGVQLPQATTTGADACLNVVKQWAATLGAAKKCSLEGTAPKCAKSVDGSIAGCGDFTFVDESNHGEIAELDAMKKEWVSLGCKTQEPCKPAATAPKAASCVATGQQGTAGQCADQP